MADQPCWFGVGELAFACSVHHGVRLSLNDGRCRKADRMHQSDWSDFEPRTDRDHIAFSLMVAGHYIDPRDGNVGVALDYGLADMVLEDLTNRGVRLIWPDGDPQYPTAADQPQRPEPRRCSDPGLHDTDHTAYRCQLPDGHRGWHLDDFNMVDKDERRLPCELRWPSASALADGGAE